MSGRGTNLREHEPAVCAGLSTGSAAGTFVLFYISDFLSGLAGRSSFLLVECMLGMLAEESARRSMIGLSPVAIRRFRGYDSVAWSHGDAKVLAQCLEVPRSWR
jgi:hypothetical protein